MTHIAHNLNQLQQILRQARADNKTIALVPTMGALHSGHLSLIELAALHADFIVVSIFVNKAQFAPHEDFAKYPRTEEQDLELLKNTKADLVYLPNSDEMYNKDFSTSINVGKIGKILEGKIRPHFFAGVALVVTKLLLQTKPNYAVFGEKDYQQLVIVKKLVKELNIDTQILGGAIIREEDGLAMSSRNRYLDPKERKIAPELYKTLISIKEQIQDQNNPDINDIIEKAKLALLAKGFANIDYIELRNKETLKKTKKITGNRLLGAARIGNTRIIDNITLL